jgi:hypothetical protein
MRLAAITHTARFTALVARSFVLFAVVASMLGCPTSNYSRVEEADSVDTGKRRYDSFFEAVIELRDEVKEIDSDLFPIREPLVETLDLNVDVALATLIDEVRRRVAEERHYGVPLNLRIMPTPKLIIERGTFDATDDDETLVRSIEESANRALSTYKKFRGLLKALQQLDKRRGKLAESLDEIEAGYPKRDVIEEELVGAGRVLRAAEKKLYRDTRTLSFFIIALADATDTGAADKADQKCQEALAKYRPRKRRRPRRRRKQPTRPPPSGGDDFTM